MFLKPFLWVKNKLLVLPFLSDYSPYTCAVIVDACPCLAIGIRTNKKGAIIHFDHSTNPKSVINYLKSNFINQGPIEVLFNGVDSPQLKSLLKGRFSSQQERVDYLTKGILSACKGTNIKIIDRTKPQDINVATNEQNTLGISNQGFFIPFFYHNGLFYQQGKEKIESIAPLESEKVEKFLNVYNSENRQMMLCGDYVYQESPHRLGTTNKLASEFPLDIINVPMLISDKISIFPNLFPRSHWQTNPVWTTPRLCVLL